MRLGSETLCQFSIRVMLLYVKAVPDRFASVAPKRNDAESGRAKGDCRLPLSSLSA